LWESGRPIGKQRRFADTLGGSRISADRGQRNHKGRVFNWRIQGTVADIINSASLEIIQREKTEGWMLLFPVHDSIYVVGKIQQSEELKQVIVRKAKDLGLDLSVDVKSYVVGKSQ
jgi:DNA polymerase I-like protein with 3'-5' exonuclease and polymerase domains